MLDDKKVQESIKAGLMAYKGMAKWYLKGAERGSVAKRWKRLPLKEQVAAARALVQMETVAKSPKDFFSREATEADWRASAEEFAKEHNCSIYSAYLIVLGPRELVFHKLEPALQQPLQTRLYHFLKAILDYEYAKNGSSKEICAEKVMADSEKVCTQYDIVSSKGLTKLIKQIKYDFAR